MTNDKQARVTKVTLACSASEAIRIFKGEAGKRFNFLRAFQPPEP